MSHVLAIFVGMSTSGKFYQPRHPEDSPFFKVLEANFDTFEVNFPTLFQPKYGFWRPVIRKSLDKFLKCGDLREGFAIVRCRDCGDEKFVAFSCKQRSCCPSCDKKRSIILGRRLTTCHILLTDGCFYGDKGMFRVAPPLELKKLEAIFRHKVFRLLLKRGRMRIPTQVATRFRFIAPPDSDLSRHPIPVEVATGFRSISPPPGRRGKDAG